MAIALNHARSLATARIEKSGLVSGRLLARALAGGRAAQRGRKTRQRYVASSFWMSAW